MKKFKVDGIIWKWQKWDYLTAGIKLFEQSLIDGGLNWSMQHYNL